MRITRIIKNTACGIIGAVVVHRHVKRPMRVAAGAIAKKWLHERYGVVIRGYLSQLGLIVALSN